MSNSNAVRTILVPWRKICASLPAVALMSTGIAFAAPYSPAQDFSGVAVSSNSPAVVVPDTALTMPAVRAPSWTDPFAMAAPPTPGLVPPGSLAPGPVSSKDSPSGGAGSAALDSTGVPVRALEAYRAAAVVVGAADPACHVDWALLAAFGRVESNHARFGGNQLDAAAVAQPGIIGIPLDGTNGTARIMDSDGGLLDRDTIYDRAVGPMQFIPGTWRAMGVDADGDGVKNPQDMADSATATAVYVCSGAGDLSRPDDLHAAVMRYNPSESYASTVTAIAAAYRLGVTALPASDPPTTTIAPLTSVGPQVGPISRAQARAARTQDAQTSVDQTPARLTAATPTPVPKTPAASPPALAPRPSSAPAPASVPEPAALVTTLPEPVPVPVTTVPEPAPVPVTTLPEPAPAQTTILPVPCLPVPTAIDPAVTDPAATVPPPAETCLPCAPDPTPTLATSPTSPKAITPACTIVPPDPTPTSP